MHFLALCFLIFSWDLEMTENLVKAMESLYQPNFA